MHAAKRPERTAAASFTIDEWCAHRRVSRSEFYNMKARGTAPRTHRIGKAGHVRISAEADRDWLRKREKEGAA